MHFDQVHWFILICQHQQNMPSNTKEQSLTLWWQRLASRTRRRRWSLKTGSILPLPPLSHSPKAKNYFSCKSIQVLSEQETTLLTVCSGCGLNGAGTSRTEFCEEATRRGAGGAWRGLVFLLGSVFPADGEGHIPSSSSLIDFNRLNASYIDNNTKNYWK